MSSTNGKIKGVRLVLAILLFSPAIMYGQSAEEIKEMFKQAESYYLYGEYDLANPIYLTIASFQADNYNILYKVGNCYLNIPDEKFKAIEYLEKAIKNASIEAKPDQIKEKRAPLDAYFFLAKAYMINNELDKAMSTFLAFQKLAAENKSKGTLENIEFIDQQVLACKNAMKFQEKPLRLEKTKLPADFSMGSINENPAVSYDGNSIAYTERRGLSNAIFYSKRERGVWQTPIEITADLNAGEDCATNAMNHDGTVLYLYKDDMYDGNIYTSTLVNDKWTPIKKLNKNINTKYFESHASVSFDGKKLYFSSNREGGLGGLDIYVSEKDALGEWGVPVNLGKEVNTPFNEDTPFITRNDSVLYFSSEGHNSMGGHDVFKSKRTAGGWMVPENIGFPISTTDDDRFFEPFNNGVNAYFSMPTDYKKRELFYLGIGTAAIDRVFEISGTVALDDSIQKPDQRFRIYLVDKVSSDTLQTNYPAKETGAYSFTVNPGDFRVYYSGPDFLTESRDTLLKTTSSIQKINFDVILKKDPSIVYEKINLTEIPQVKAIDTAILVKDLKVADVVANETDTTILYYTVQVMALYNPVDVSYFKHITDMKVIYNDVDRFYRYTTGQFSTKAEAASWRAELLRKGYPDQIFIKKVTK